jgi:hypothetical protein
MIQRYIAAVVAVALLSGCATVEPGRTGIATPVGAAVVLTFKPEARVVPRAHAVNAQVARLLDHQQEVNAKPLVAAR